MRLQLWGWSDGKMSGSNGGNLRSVLGGSKTICFSEGYEEAASLPCFSIAFIAKQSISVFDGYGAYASFIRKKPFGREFAVVRKHSFDNVITQLLVYLQINRSLFFLNNIFHLVILFSPFLVVL